MADPSYLSVKEFAERFGMRKHAALALIHKGELDGVLNIATDPKSRARFRIPLTAIEEWVERRTHRPATPQRRRRRRRTAAIEDRFPHLS